MSDDDDWDWLLPIGGDPESLDAERRRLETWRDFFWFCSKCAENAAIDRWRGRAADSFDNVRHALVTALWNTGGWHDDAAKAVARFTETLREIKFRRRMLGLETIAANPVHVAEANEDVARLEQQAVSEGQAAAEAIDRAGQELDALGSVFAGRSPGPEHRPSSVPSGKNPGDPNPEVVDEHREPPSLYMALKDSVLYRQRVQELNVALTDAASIIVPARSVTNWDDWGKAPGRGVGRLDW